MQSVCWCGVSQMTRCPDRAPKPKLLRTSWTSIGTSRGPVQAMEPRQEPPTMELEVRKIKLALTHMTYPCSGQSKSFMLYFCMFSQIFVSRTTCMTLQEKTPCRIFPQMTSQTRLARRHSNMISSSPSGLTLQVLCKTHLTNGCLTRYSFLNKGCLFFDVD